MDGNHYETISDTEFCPECGKPIVYGHTELMGTEYNMPLKCRCVIEREEKEREQRIIQGRELDSPGYAGICWIKQAKF